jgi:hypothetical protein
LTGATGLTGAGGASGYWGSFWSTQNQSATAINTEYPITYNNTDPDGIGVSIVANSQITFQYTGVYSITFSVQWNNSDNQIHDANIWLKKNGTNVADTDSRWSIVESHGGSDGRAIGTVNYVLKVLAGEYLELFWQTNNLGITLEYAPALAPAPAIPSVILTATQVMYGQLGATGATGVGAQGATGATGAVPSNVAYNDINNNFTAGQTITAAANTSALSATYSVTGANTTPLQNLTGTWNTTGVARGILLNITDTASNALSLFCDFQVGGSSRFSVSKTGSIYFGSTSGTLIGDVLSGVALYYSNTLAFHSRAAQVAVPAASAYSWSSTSTAGQTSDLFLYRDGANTLAQRNGANAQIWRLYGTFTDASNNRRLDITSTTAGVFTLTATGIGTGATGNLLKLTQPILLPATSVTLATNGDLAFEATSNTSLTIRYRGSDGTTRSATLALI